MGWNRGRNRLESLEMGGERIGNGVNLFPHSEKQDLSVTFENSAIQYSINSGG